MILVFVEHEAGTLRPASQDVLAFARGIAASTGGVVDAVAIGDGGTAADVARSLSGVNTLHTVAIGDGAYAPAAWAQAVAGVAGAAKPKAVIAAATDRGQEILSYLGAKMALPMIANGLDVEFGDAPVVTREQWGGAVHEKVRCSAAPLLMSVAPAAVVRDGHAQGAARDGVAAVEETVFDAASDDLRVRLARTEPVAGPGIGLSEARLVVSGGRGVGGPEGFAALEELAGQLVAAVGVSRAVTSAGWRPHSEQIGQTGVRIAPDLYVACGISGASQHMVGCLGAKRILAINTDGEASIMARADYAVVGDLHLVVPAIVEEMRLRKGTA